MPASSRSYTRLLSPTERFNLAINELYRYNIVALAEGQGSLSQEELQHAVNTAAMFNPGVRVRIKSWLGWSRWVDSGEAPRVHEIQAPDWNCFDERGADFMDGSFEPLAGGAVCDFYLIPGTTMRIVARALHAAMDARGLQHFVKDVFRVLRGETPVGADSCLTDLNVRRQHQDAIKDQPPAMNCMPILEPRVAVGAPLHYVWRRVIVDRNISSMLPKMALFLAQYAHNRSEGEVGFTIPVDLRGLRADIATTANMTGYLRIKVEPQMTAKQIMQQINQGVKAHVDCIIPAIYKWVPWIPLRLLVRDLRKNADKLLYNANPVLPSGGIVSMGMFKAEDYSCPKFQASTCIGIPGSVGKMNVVIMNHSDHTEVVFSTPAAYNTEGQLDTMITAFKEAMMQPQAS